MKKEELTHEESLVVIQRMVDIAKNKIDESGSHFLLWGVLVILASTTQYIMIESNYADLSYWVWFIMPLVGVKIAFIYEYKRRKKAPTKTKFDKIYNALWLGLGITLALSIFLSVSLKVNPIPFILLLVGLAIFVSGAIFRFNPLIVSALVFWTASMVCLKFEQHHQLVINAVALFLGYIIPRVLLYAKAKKERYV